MGISYRKSKKLGAILLGAVLALAGACAAEEGPKPDSGPVEDSIPMASTTTTPPETTVAPTTAAPTTAAPTTAKPQPLVATTARPAPTTTAAPTTAGVYYANCDEARAAGAAPISRGEPGYRSGLDRDGDGVACDK